MYTQQTQQKTVNDLLYSTSAAARILGINYQDIQKLAVDTRRRGRALRAAKSAGTSVAV